MLMVDPWTIASTFVTAEPHGFISFVGGLISIRSIVHFDRMQLATLGP